MIGTGTPSFVSGQDMTPRLKKILEQSFSEARQTGHNVIGTEHLLMALLRERDSKGVEIIELNGADIKEIYSDILESMGLVAAQGDRPDQTNRKPGKKTHKDTPTLDTFGRDLTDMAEEHKIDPVIGRSKEIERVIQILSRRTKNNPCLIGEPGVGKTAIARRSRTTYCRW